MLNRFLQNKHHLAFSLLEVSVVFMIIGILISGLTVGIDLYQDYRLIPFPLINYKIQA